MYLAFTQMLGFHIWKTNIRAQKIDNSTVEASGMVIVDF